MAIIELNVLLVEDQSNDMKSYLRDFPAAFEESGVKANFHAAPTFEKAHELIQSSHIRFDLILSDTFRGEQTKRDAAVIEMVINYRKGRFCPMIVFSASAKPEALVLGAFVMWADKAKSGEIELIIKKMLATGIPQLARTLHDELDRTAGGYLWEFIEKHYIQLTTYGPLDGRALTRLIRRRAALYMAELDHTSDPPAPLTAVEGFEYYIYPPLHKSGYCLGSIIMKKALSEDIRVVLTPHCHLTVQPGNTEPRAKYVLTVKTIIAKQLLGEKLTNAKANADTAILEKLRRWSTPPSGDSVGKPDGRYWYLPAFIDIPHTYCDFQQVESIPYSKLADEYTSVAVLTPPFAESLQACFVTYHSSVGIPNVRPESIRSLVNS